MRLSFFKPLKREPGVYIVCLPVFVIDQLAQNMADQYVHLLNACRIVRGYDDVEVADIVQFSAPFAAEPNRPATKLPGLLHRIDHVGAVSAGGDADQKVSFLRQRFDLAREYPVISKPWSRFISMMSIT